MNPMPASATSRSGGIWATGEFFSAHLKTRYCLKSPKSSTDREIHTRFLQPMRAPGSTAWSSREYNIFLAKLTYDRSLSSVLFHFLYWKTSDLKKRNRAYALPYWNQKGGRS